MRGDNESGEVVGYWGMGWGCVDRVDGGHIEERAGAGVSVGSGVMSRECHASHSSIASIYSIHCSTQT
jgi:hypothetical protein